MKVKVAQSCPTLCDPIDHTVRGIFQARIPEWVAIPFFRDLPNPGTEARITGPKLDAVLKHCDLVFAFILIPLPLSLIPNY